MASSLAAGGGCVSILRHQHLIGAMLARGAADLCLLTYRSRQSLSYGENEQSEPFHKAHILSTSLELMF